MDKEIKDKWIAALRSGKYEQGKRKLRKDDKFCCLGVLCEIYDVEPEEYYDVEPEEYYDVEPEEYYEEEAYKWLKQHMDMVTMQILWTMNDYQNKTFIEIADYIEKEL